MIVDHRTYNVKIGKLAEFLKLYETECLPLQLKHLGHCVGWYVSNEIGPLSQVVHMWAYKDLADRDARRAKMAAEPGFGKYLEKAGPTTRRDGEQNPEAGSFFQAAGTAGTRLSA